MLLLGSTMKMERVVDLLLLCALDWQQPVPRWYGYCNNCPLLHMQREGKFSVAFPEERADIIRSICQGFWIDLETDH